MHRNKPAKTERRQRLPAVRCADANRTANPLPIARGSDSRRDRRDHSCRDVRRAACGRDQRARTRRPVRVACGLGPDRSGATGNGTAGRRDGVRRPGRSLERDGRRLGGESAPTPRQRHQCHIAITGGGWLDPSHANASPSPTPSCGSPGRRSPIAFMSALESSGARLFISGPYARQSRRLAAFRALESP